MARQETGLTDTTLRISRVIKASRDRVFRAFVDLDSPQLHHFAPDAIPGKPMRVEHHEFDPREGGRYRGSLIAEEGEHKGVYTAHGTFEEVIPNERIVQTHQWEGDEASPTTCVTVTFRDIPGGTEVTILHEGLPGRASVEGHAEGWTEALANLAAAFEREAAG